MKSNLILKKIAAGLMSAAMLFSGSSLMSDSGVPFFADQTAITASAWDSHDPHNYGSTLYASIGRNKTLKPGDYLCNGNYRAILQGDGNFVIYNNRGSARWCTYTALTANGNNAYSNYRFVVQEDGNLVLYGKPKANGGDRWIWASGTNGAKGNYTLKLESNGVLNLYRSATASGTKIWTDSDKKVRWHIDVKTQNDPAYRSNGIYPFVGENIWGVGCALASTTMIYNYYKGTNVNPTALNNSTYLDGNSWLRWGNVGATDERGRTFSCAELANRLKTGPVIVYISYRHFIVVHQCTKASGTFTTNDFRVIDPAYTYNGSSNMTLAQAMSQIGGSSIVQMDYWSQSAGRNMPNV